MDEEDLNYLGIAKCTFAFLVPPDKVPLARSQPVSLTCASIVSIACEIRAETPQTLEKVPIRLEYPHVGGGMAGL